MRFLKNNVFITAPSDSVSSDGDKKRLENAIQNFLNMGIDVKLGETVNLKNVYDDAEYKLKASELENALLNENVDTVIAANGGDTEFNIIKYIDFNKLCFAENKIFQGFSDNSIVTFLLTTLSNWKTYYAPCFPTFGYENWDQTLNDNMNLLKGIIIEQSSQEYFETNSFKKIKGKELYGYNLDTKTQLTEITGKNSFIVHGTLLGGCLDVLKDIVGTEYDKMIDYNQNHTDIIWFIENCAMNIDELEQTLKNMESNEWFKKVCCFMIGRGKITLNKEFQEEQNELLIRILSKYNVPIIANCDFGHVRPFNTLITGADICLKYENGKYSIKYENIE